MLVVVTSSIAFVARNDVVSRHAIAGRVVMSLDLSTVMRVGVLQMSTMAGVVVAATVGAALAGATGHAEEQLLATLEPRSGRRWSTGFATIVMALLVATVAAVLLTAAAGALQAHRLHAPLRIAAHHWPGLQAASLHGGLTMLGLASVAVLISQRLSTSPAVIVAVAVGGTWAMFLLQQLLGAAGDVALPTAWVARWLHLATEDYGVAYLWTTGAYADGRSPAGGAIAVMALGCAFIGWRQAGAVERG
jgi:hypothetical protein